MCIVCQASRGMGKWFTRYAFRHVYGWRQRTDHVPDCYFCLTGVTAKSKHPVQCPNLPSEMRPVPHGAELLLPKLPANMTLSDSESSDEDVGQANNNMYCYPRFAYL
jgi:hypothetical protein